MTVLTEYDRQYRVPKVRTTDVEGQRIAGLASLEQDLPLEPKFTRKRRVPLTSSLSLTYEPMLVGPQDKFSSNVIHRARKPMSELIRLKESGDVHFEDENARATRKLSSPPTVKLPGGSQKQERAVQATKQPIKVVGKLTTDGRNRTASNNTKPPSVPKLKLDDSNRSSASRDQPQKVSKAVMTTSPKKPARSQQEPKKRAQTQAKERAVEAAAADDDYARRYALKLVRRRPASAIYETEYQKNYRQFPVHPDRGQHVVNDALIYRQSRAAEPRFAKRHMYKQNFETEYSGNFERPSRDFYSLRRAVSESNVRKDIAAVEAVKNANRATIVASHGGILPHLKYLAAHPEAVADDDVAQAIDDKLKQESSTSFLPQQVTSSADLDTNDRHERELYLLEQRKLYNNLVKQHKERTMGSHFSRYHQGQLISENNCEWEPRYRRCKKPAPRAASAPPNRSAPNADAALYHSRWPAGIVVPRTHGVKETLTYPDAAYDAVLSNEAAPSNSTVTERSQDDVPASPKPRNVTRSTRSADSQMDDVISSIGSSRDGGGRLTTPTLKQLKDILRDRQLTDTEVRQLQRRFPHITNFDSLLPKPDMVQRHHLDLTTPNVHAGLLVHSPPLQAKPARRPRSAHADVGGDVYTSMLPPAGRPTRDTHKILDYYNEDSGVLSGCDLHRVGDERCESATLEISPPSDDIDEVTPTTEKPVKTPVAPREVKNKKLDVDSKSVATDDSVTRWSELDSSRKHKKKHRKEHTGERIIVPTQYRRDISIEKKAKPKREFEEDQFVTSVKPRERERVTYARPDDIEYREERYVSAPRPSSTAAPAGVPTRRPMPMPRCRPESAAAAYDASRYSPAPKFDPLSRRSLDYLRNYQTMNQPYVAPRTAVPSGDFLDNYRERLGQISDRLHHIYDQVRTAQY